MYGSRPGKGDFIRHPSSCAGRTRASPYRATSRRRSPYEVGLRSGEQRSAVIASRRSENRHDSEHELAETRAKFLRHVVTTLRTINPDGDLGLKQAKSACFRG